MVATKKTIRISNFMPSNVLVSGLDIYNEISPNGTYLYGGFFNDKSRYDKSETDRIIWYGGSWLIIGSEETLFSSDEDVAYPWLVTNWTAQDGTGDPVITEVPVSSQNTFGLPADVVALITSRFGTVANFLRLRNQGQI